MLRKRLHLALSILLFVVIAAGCTTPGPSPGVVPSVDAAPQQTAHIVAPKLQPRALVLLPIPRDVAFTGSARAVAGPAQVFVTDKGLAAATEILRESVDTVYAATSRASAGGQSVSIRVAVNPAAVPQDQGYRLAIDADAIHLTGHDAPGVFYGAMTLRQIARQYAGTQALPLGVIEDWPDFPTRGVMLDVARCKVPEMATLFALVEHFAEWKFNQLQLYTEHSYAYRGHHTVWEEASPMTAEQIRALDAYCKARYIELVPNQNSFGHMGRWLGKPEYQHLSEMPGGGGDLCPVDPGSIALLADMYRDMLPNFSSGQFNVGCDETWSLGKGRSKAACGQHGVGRVYFDFLLQIHELCQEQGRAMQFWGDIIMHHPELIPEIPKGMIAMEWGYEANHPFAAHGKKFAASQIPFYVVPGTSTWNSLVGRTDNALANLRNAAENGLANGAIGYLVTDWGDGGHWQFQPMSYLPFAYAAGVSWAYDANKDLDAARAVDVHLFEDAAGVMGRLAHDLGNAHLQSGVHQGNRSFYYSLLQYNLEGKPDESMTAAGLLRTLEEVDRVMARLPDARMACPDAEQIQHEFELAAALIRLACHLGIARVEAGGVGTSAIPTVQRHELASQLEALIPEFRQLWLARNRCGGLKESAGRFERLLKLLQAP